MELNFASSATIFSSAVGAFHVPFSTMVSNLILRQSSICWVWAPCLLCGCLDSTWARLWWLHYSQLHIPWRAWWGDPMSFDSSLSMIGLEVWHIGWTCQCHCQWSICNCPSWIALYKFGCSLCWCPSGSLWWWSSRGSHRCTGCCCQFCIVLTTGKSSFLHC